MRLIKYRAWHKQMESMDEVMMFNDKFCLIGMYNLGDFHLDEVVLMQFTNLKDKNGVEIYEGDIVKMHYFYEGHDPVTFGRYEAERNVIGVVKMDAMGTYTETNEEYGIYHWLEYLQEPAEELEVIGNIYQNEELLKESE